MNTVFKVIWNLIKLLLLWFLISFALMIFTLYVNPNDKDTNAILFIVYIFAPPLFYWYARHARKKDEEAQEQLRQVELAKLNLLPEDKFNQLLVVVENDNNPVAVVESFFKKAKEEEIELSPDQKNKLRLALILGFCRTKTVPINWGNSYLKEAPFVVQSTETVIYGSKFNELWTTKTERHYQAGNRGMSLRIMKGVSVRVGNTAGKSVSQEVREELDGGQILATTKHIYYEKNGRPQRVALAKIIGTELFDNGKTIKIMPDGARAKPLYFFFNNIYDPVTFQEIINAGW